MKKNIIFLSLLAMQSSALLFSQDLPRTDTMSVILNGEHIIVPVPKEGNKTTISMEDSTSIIQISVSKTSKFKTGSTAPTPKHAAARQAAEKYVSWFNEVDIALVAFALDNSRYDRYSGDTGYSYNFSINTGSNQGDGRVTILTLAPKKVFPGFAVGFTIREKTRTIGHSRFYFTTGSRFRYSRFSGKGDYDIREIKSATVNGMVTYYPDTVYSIRKGEYTTVNNTFSLLLPFLVGTKMKKNPNVSIAAGINLSININSSKISENIKENYSIISYINPQIIQFQPIIKASHKRTSAFFSYGIGKTIIGYGAAQRFSGNKLFFGMAFKLY